MVTITAVLFGFLIASVNGQVPNNPISGGGFTVNSQQQKNNNAANQPIRSVPLMEPSAGTGTGIGNVANEPKLNVGGNRNGVVVGRKTVGSPRHAPLPRRNGFLGRQTSGFSVNNNQAQQQRQFSTVNNRATSLRNWQTPNRRRHQRRNRPSGTIQPVYQTNNKISFFQDKNLIDSYGLTRFLKLNILEEHNAIRSDVNSISMNVLRWNESLAGQAWMDVKDCVYKNRRNGAVQAMIHEKKTGNSMFSEAISRWSDEKNFFDPYMPCNVRNSCRYSQLVWATSREVGCARKKCNDMSFITCMYYPVGNTAGYTAYVEGTRCEGCKNSCNSDKLCEWPPNSQPQQGSAFGTPPMGQNRFGNQPMMQQPFF